MRIIGIDPGTGILGFGVIEVIKGQSKLVDAGKECNLILQNLPTIL